MGSPPPLEEAPGLGAGDSQLLIRNLWHHRGTQEQPLLLQGHRELDGGIGAPVVFPGSGVLRVGGCSRGRSCSDHPSPVKD